MLILDEAQNPVIRGLEELRMLSIAFHLKRLTDEVVRQYIVPRVMQVGGSCCRRNIWSGQLSLSRAHLRAFQ